MDITVTLEETITVAAMAEKRPTPIVRDAHSLLVRGIDALERNHIDEAIALLRQTIDLDQRSFYGHLALGIALTKALKISEAERSLETAIELEPKNFYAHLRMAELYQRVGIPVKAKEKLQIALDCAKTSEEKSIARDLLSIEVHKDATRAWRPDFTKLRGWRKKK